MGPIPSSLETHTATALRRSTVSRKQREFHSKSFSFPNPVSVLLLTRQGDEPLSNGIAFTTVVRRIYSQAQDHPEGHKEWMASWTFVSEWKTIVYVQLQY